VSSTIRLSGLYTNRIPESGYLLADKSKVKLTIIEMTSKKETLFKAFFDPNRRLQKHKRGRSEGVQKRCC
jgi:hypothetical protein